MHPVNTPTALPSVAGLNMPMRWATTTDVPHVDTTKDMDYAPNEMHALIETLDKTSNIDKLLAFYVARPLNEDGFAKTLRYMHYRAFLRRYLGVHQKRWSSPVAGVSLLVSGFLVMTIYQTRCGLPQTTGLITAGVILFLSLWLTLLTRAPTAVKICVWLEVTFLAISLVTLIATVIVGAGEKHLKNGRSLRTAMENIFFRGSGSPGLLGSPCESYGAGMVSHWLVFSFVGLNSLVLLCEVFWSRVFNHLGEWYYLRSRLFIRSWRLYAIKPAKILSPAQPRRIVNNANKDEIKTREAQKFKLQQGIQVEWVATLMFGRLWRRMKRCACCGVWCFGPEVKNELPQSKSIRRRGAKWPWRVVYTGNIDDEGRPHGFGFWKGDLMHGETLVGFWEHGKPSGPYKSREVSTGSGFMCIKVGFARCQLSNKPVRFGICNVECSVSGRFYRGFPAVEMVDGPSSFLEGGPKVKKSARARFGSLMTRRRHTIQNSRSADRPFTPAISENDVAERTHSMLNLTKQLVPSVSAQSDYGPFSDIWLTGDKDQKSDQPPVFKTLGLREKFLQTDYVESVNWLLARLHPHTPTFGIQPRSEVVVSVDRERGVDIMGYVPLSQIVIEDKGGITQRYDATKLAMERAPSTEKLAVHFEIANKGLMEVDTDEVHQPGQTNAAARIDYFAPELIVEGWVSMEAVGISEVLLYVHGYNNSQAEAIKMLGQMAAFGNFPPHLKIIVFSWPAGKGLFSFSLAKSHAEQTAAHDAFRDVLLALREDGIRQIHILCHSMGARLFLKSMQSVFKEQNLIARLHTSGHSNKATIDAEIQGKLQMLTCTFLNPEYYLDEFVNDDYHELRQHCAHITIYADGNDKALYWAEVRSRHEALGRSVFGLRSCEESDSNNLAKDCSPAVPCRTIPEDQTLETTTRQDTESPPSLMNSKLPKLRFMHTISFFQMEESGIENNATPDHHHSIDINSPPSKSCLCRRNKTQKKADGEWLDLDIIDTTFMDQNVHGLRHSFWNLNREIIEDLRELLVTRKRARQRFGRLDRRDGNVWVFRVAPSFLTSIFDSPF